MEKYFLKFSGIFLLVTALQLLFFNNIQISGYINPYIYITFILLLPYNISGGLLLILGFLTGLTMDVFMNTYGVHSSATLFMAFIRPYVLQLLTDRSDMGQLGYPSLRNSGFEWFIKYSIILVFAHHLSLFLIESFSFSMLLSTIWRTILSTLVTVTSIFIGLLLIEKK